MHAGIHTPPMSRHPQSRHPLRADIPLGADPPKSRHPPGADTPLGVDTPLQSMLGDTVNMQVVHILLECNLVMWVLIYICPNGIVVTLSDMS